MNIGTLTIEMAANVARLAKDMDAARRTVERTFGSIERDVARLKGLLGGLFSGLSASAFVGKLVDVQRQFDVLNSSLITVTGSSAAAAREFAWIKQFAATTPFQLAEVTSAFVKMKALGLDASQAALTSYGNTASAMGKSLNQMIEAVADAATGEFERLKEFGIKAKQQGDQVTLTFQGVSKTIGNNAAEITAYLQAIGNNEFAGAMAQRAQTLDGAISNLADTWDELFRTISQQPAGGLIYDSVKLASGAIEDMITILNALNGATAENAKQTGAMKVIQEGIAIVFETVAVLGVNLKYILVQIGREIGGIAAQAAAILRGDFAQAGEIRRMMIADAEAARQAVDATTERILNARRLSEQTRKSLEGVDTRAEDARLARYAQSSQRALSTVTAAAATAKKGVDEFAKSVERGVQFYGDLTAQSVGLSGNFAEQWQNLANAYKAGKINLEQLTAAQALLLEQQPFAKELAKEQEESTKALAKAEFERIEALERSAASTEEQLRRLLDEEKAVTIAAEKNITLAQALEEVAIARLREQQAALMREGDRDAEVLAIQREIDARKKLAEAIGRKEAREAAADSAREAEREWQRTAENIERSLTDALLRGFESGKDFARNLRDTVVNMFQSLVLRPVIQAVVSPVAGAITGALGLPGTANAATGGPGAFGMASSLKSIYDTVVGGFTALGNSVAFAAHDIGAWLVNNTTGVLNRFGGTLMSNAGALGTAGSYLGGVGAGTGLGSMIAGQYKVGGLGGRTSSTIGAVIGALTGNPIGAAIGGAVGGLVNRAFGRKLKDQGIEGTFGGDGFTGNAYEFYKGGWFRSNKTKRSALDPELDSALDQQFMAIKTTALGLGEVLGVARTALDGFSQSIKLSFKGLNEQQIQEKLNEVFNGLGESMARSILSAGAVAGDTFIKEGETAQKALVRLAVSLQAVNGAIDLLGGNLLEASLASGELASKIVEAFGGLDQFGSAVQTYYANFYTEQERLAKAVESMGEAFAGLGLTMPKTKEEFRALVEAQDVTTESGRKTLAALLNLSGAFAEIADASQKALNGFADEAKRLQAQLLELQGDAEGAKEILRALATEGLTELEIAAYDANEALRAQIQALQERSSLEERLLQLRGDTAALRAKELSAVDASNRSVLQQIWAIEDARAATDAAFAALERAIDAQRTSVTAMRDAAQEQVDSVTAVFDVLKSNIEELYDEAASTSAMSAAAGQAFIAQALATARSTGYLPDSDELSQAIRAARGGLSSERYASAFEAERDQLVLAGRLSQLREISGNQLTTAEQQLKVAEQQLESLDGQLATARAQLDALRGVDQRALSVEQAIRELNVAMAAELRALGGALAASKALSAPPVESLSSPAAAAAAGYITSPVNEYGSYTGIGDSGYRLQVTSSGATLYFPGGGSHAVSGPTAAQLLTDTYGLKPGGLNGTLIRTRAQGGYTPPGLTLVGEEGPELINFRNPGMVYTAAQTANLLRGDNSELINEVRQLREENQAQARAMVQLQARVTRLLERWDGNGMPETRSVTA